MTPTERNELRWLRKVAKLSSEMVKHIDFDAVKEHARKYPGTTGPSLKSSAARTRDLMTALSVLGLITHPRLAKENEDG